jgi:UDP-N-acetylglucosamine 2-epimerase
MHPRTAAALREVRDWRAAPELIVTDPVAYDDMLALLQGAAWVATDSGGLQKEAYFLDCPCITLRNETEWLETLENGANVVAGSDGTHLVELVDKVMQRPQRSFGASPPARMGPFGTGRAAEEVVAALCKLCETTYE